MLVGWVTVCSTVPAVHNCITGLVKRNPQLLHLGSIKTQLPPLTAQRHQHQARLLSAGQHVSILCDDQPVTGAAKQNMCTICFGANYEWFERCLNFEPLQRKTKQTTKLSIYIYNTSIHIFTEFSKVLVDAKCTK